MFNFNIDKPTTSDEFDNVLKWDLLIIGGGPAGLNAALYAKRKGLTVGIITEEIGGQLHNTSIVDNELGIMDIEGEKLSDTFLEHLDQYKVPILKNQRVRELKQKGPDYELNVTDGRTFLTKTVLIATGGAPRKLDIPGEAQYANKGVTYCATCDAPFFKDKHVIVAGGGNSAAEGVLDLVPYASKITVVHRSKWRADEILLKKLESVENLTVHLQTQIKEVLGETLMTGLRVLDKETNEERVIEADGLLVEIGTIPNSYLIKDLVETNERNEVIVNNNQETSLKGLYAAGDVTTQQDKQIIISVAEGAKVALAVNRYLNNEYKGE